ncbi:MAG TPA: phage major capsid protein [Lysobacter sp.]
MNAVLRESPRPSRRTRRRPPAQLLFRAAAVNAYGFAHDVPAHVAADRLFAGDEGLHAFLNVQKAAIDPALTTVPDWAGNLARETWAEFVTLLGPDSVYSQLAARGLRFTFSGGKVRHPARSSTPSLSGDFIGENAPIPVRKASVLASSLGPKRIGVLTVMSSELDGATGFDMETFLRAAITEDTNPVIDARLLDNAAATAVRPAGLLNGVTLTPSAGTTLDNIITDLKTALAPVLLAGGGRRLVWLMNPLQAMSLSLQTDAAGAVVWPDAARRLGIADVIVSNNVPAGTLLVVDAAEFVTVADPAPRFEVTREASLHMNDAPTSINNGTMAAPVTSLFQQDGVGIRMIQQMNWTMRRTGMVAGVSGIEW